MTWRRAASEAGVYIVAAIVLTWPLARDLTGRIGALQGPGDPFLNLWILGWGLHAWTHDPLSVLSGRVLNANIFHPAEGTLAYSDHLLLQAFALSPVYALTGNAVLCYNLLLLISIAASGWAMHFLVRTLTGSTPAAFAAGVAWACWPYRTAHLQHIQLQALYLMPLALLCLHWVVARRRWRDAALLGVVAGFQAIASVSYGPMGLVMLAVASVALAVSTGQWRSYRLWSRLGVAAVLAVVVIGPTVVSYARVQQSEGFGRTPFEAFNRSASWQSYTQVPPVNLLYGRTGVLGPRAPAPGQPDRQGVEHWMFPGLVLLALAGVGLISGWRGDGRPLVVSAAALVVVGGVLSLGPNGWRSLYAAIPESVYGVEAVRAPGRFAVVAFMGLSLLAAVGVRSTLSRAGAGIRDRARRLRRGRWLTVLLLAGLSAEYLNGPLPLAAAPPRHTAIGYWLASESLPGAVLHLPLGNDIDNTAAMVQSLEHRRPIVNGYSGQRPAFFPAVVESLEEFPSRDSLAAIRELDVRFIVAPAPVAGAGNERSPLVERARFDDGVIYEVRWTPEAIAAMGELSGPPPPPAGEPLFTAGESATYDIYWDGGPLNIASGRAVLKVLEGSAADPRWRFEVQAETADWVSRFFHARDRFTTIADASLLPIEHSREIEEGGPQVNRTYVYDRTAGNVRVGESRAEALAADAVTLPLGHEAARDALTALYYVRTLPLTQGSIVNVPINDGGAILQLQVAAAEPETITYRGQPTAAVRLEPRLMRRIERRRPVTMTLWMSADGRIPLRAVLRAGFGRVRAELRDYQVPEPR